MPSVKKSRRRCTFKYERKLQGQGFLRIAGVDEVGRGALCGPVVAAAVLLDRMPRVHGIRDSKSLTAKQRVRLRPKIIRAAMSWGVGIVSAEEVDRYNIYQATLIAMHQALLQLSPVPDFILIDGSPVRGLSIPHLNVVKGDVRCISIAAASIVAKVTRDQLMKSYASMYPMYDWVRNKGYSCKSHFEALKQYGPTSLHRRSFKPVHSVPQLSLINDENHG